MNRWQLTDEIRKKFTPILKEYLDKIENMTEEEFDNVPDEALAETFDLDLFGMGINPYQLWQLIEENFNYKEDSIDRNGWEQDFWISMRRTDGKTFPSGCEHLVISGCGMTFELSLGIYGVNQTMMTNEECLNLLNKIQDYCYDQSCSECKFRVTIDKERQCQFKTLAIELSQHPCNWNMYKVQEIVVKQFMDKEKVLKAVKACSEFCCGECPYQHLDDPDGYLKLRCIHSLMVDINKLLNGSEG